MNAMDTRQDVLDLSSTHSTEQKPLYEVRETIHWQAEEFVYHEKGPQWFIVGGIITLGIFFSLLILKNVFGAATILLFAIIIYMYANKKPELLDVILDSHGVTVNGKTTPYSSIASFWILYEPPVKDLVLIYKTRFTPKIIIPLGSAHPVELRELMLANGIIEKEEEESLVDLLARRVGF